MAKRNNKKNNSRGGFTIVELVVTLTIIVLVSAVSIGVVAVNNKTYGETIDMVEATNIAENAIECFRYAANNSEYDEELKSNFESAFKKTFEDDFEFPLPVTADDSLVYTIVWEDVSVKISITNNYKTIEITAHNSEGELINTSYTK